MSKQAKVDVILNAEQAKAALKQVQDELVKVKNLRDKAMAAGDVTGYNQLNKNFKDLTSEAKKLTTQTKDVNDVLKNMSTASFKELNAAYQQMNRELKEMKRNDPGYAEKQKQVKALKEEMSSASGVMSNHGSTLKGLMGTVGGWAAGLGIATTAMGAIKSVISATDTVSDLFEETVGGITSGMGYLARSIASLDFSNFLTNMENAIKAGRDYVRELDKIGDRSRAIGIIEASDRQKLAELLIIRKDVTKTKEERIAAGYEILAIEQKNSELRKSLAKDELATQLKYAAAQSQLSEKRIGELLVEQETNREAIKDAEAYKQALAEKRAAEANAAQLSVSTRKFVAPVISKETLDIINNASPAVKKLAAELTSFGKLNEETYNKITDSYKKVGEANASYAEQTAKTQVGIAKLKKGELDEDEKINKQIIKDLKETQKTISQLIAEKDAEIEAAIQAGDIPLAKKAQIEKKAMEDLLEAYKAVKMAIEKGWSLDERGMGEIASLLSKGTGAVKSGTKTTGKGASLLVKRDSGANQSGESVDAQIKAEEKRRMDWREAEFQMANNINTTVTNMVMNRQQAELDHKLSMLEKQKAAELSNKNLTEEQKAKIEAKYDSKTKALKLEVWKKQRNADAISTAIATILAVMKAGGPLNPIGAATAVAGALGVAEILMKKPPEFYYGGYTRDDINDRRPAGIVHANEFIGSAKAVRNPTVKPVFDVIDYAQRNGTISQINLPALVASTTLKGRKSGGYISDATNMQTSASSGTSGGMFIGSETLKDLAAEIKLLRENGVLGKWSLFDLEKIQKDKSNIQSATDM
jgi:hypothetical protein